MRKLVPVLFLALAAEAAANGDGELFFREDWAETPPAIPVTQEHVTNSSLVLSLHGPGRNVIKKSHHNWVENDPFYIWSGLCHGNWAVSLAKRGAAADLTNGRVRWRAKQAGFRQLRLILELASGAWLVSDAHDGPSEDWRIREFVMKNIRWRELDIEKIVEGAWANDADLSRVASVGFTDLTSGGGSRACSRLDWIEVYGKETKR